MKPSQFLIPFGIILAGVWEETTSLLLRLKEAINKKDNQFSLNNYEKVKIYGNKTEE